MAPHNRKNSPLQMGYLWDDILPAKAGDTEATLAECEDAETSAPADAEDSLHATAAIPSDPPWVLGSSPELDDALIAVASRYRLWRDKPYVTQFYGYAGLKSTIRERRSDVLIRVSDLLEDAPPEVLRGIIDILLAKFWRRVPDAADAAAYEAYTMQPELEACHRVVRKQRGRGKLLVGSAGQHHELEPIRDEINEEYFGGRIEVPVSWSSRRMRSVLGYYDPEHHAIIISTRLDRRSVPRYVVGYVMYHELLHCEQDHGYPVRGKRRNLHGKEFRARERAYPDYERAIHWLRRKGWI